MRSTEYSSRLSRMLNIHSWTKMKLKTEAKDNSVSEGPQSMVNDGPLSMACQSRLIPIRLLFVHDPKAKTRCEISSESRKRFLGVF